MFMWQLSIAVRSTENVVLDEFVKAEKGPSLPASLSQPARVRN
jgi:hypothetical protein